MVDIKKKVSGLTCPLCGDSEVEKIREFQSTDALIHLGINKTTNKFNQINSKITKLWMQSNAEFRVCKKCTFEFASPFISGDAEFYNLVYDGNESYPEWKWDFEISFNCISKIIGNTKNSELTLLEIGAGNGSFVKRISESLIESKNIVTTEFSKDGQQKIEDLGMKCLPVGIEELIKEYENSFDFICMFQVLEHLDNIDDVFKILFKLLKKDGRLFITVPNNVHRSKFESVGIVEDVPPIHVCRWSKESFKFISNHYKLKTVGYEIQNRNIVNNINKLIFIKYKNEFEYKLSGKNANVYIEKINRRIKYLFLAIWNIKHIISILTEKNMGVSQWVHFKKE
jgi:2-polyprenyl-3-methyl-5-hydroxy-6-metoxy-1,4-benzoquinol methylase